MKIKINLDMTNPKIYLYFYLINIIFFSILYGFIFDEDFKLSNSTTSISYIQALYLSVVTITTLGYGDIIPKLNCTFLLITIILQVISGIGIIGLFLNYLSHKLGDDKAKNNSILLANEYLENNASIKEEFIIVNKVAYMNRLNKEYKQYEYILQDFYLENQFLKDLIFKNSKLYGMFIKNTTFKNISFFNIKSDSSQFINAELKTCKFMDCSLDKVDFCESKLTNIIFDNCRLSRTKLNNLYLKSPIIIKSDLDGATFENTRIENANFKNSDFSNVNFKNSVLINVNFSGAIFENNNFEGIVLENVYYNNERVRDSSFLV